jgi:hypothetical protein
VTTPAPTRGPRDVRRLLRAHLQTELPPLVPYLRTLWGDESAFPPAGVEPDSAPVPSGTNVQAVIGRPVDRWPLAQIEVTDSKLRRMETSGPGEDDAVGYWTTYSVGALVWVDIDIPESVPIEEEREYVTDVRDDIQMAMRYALVDRVLSRDPPMSVLPNSYAEDFGEPQANNGQRWSVGGRARFSVRAQERLSRPALATVTEGGFGYGVTVTELAHPAL